MNKSILIVSGEPSGDNIGGLLASELVSLRPDIKLFGLGGERMKASQVEILCHIDRLSFLGFWEVIKYIPFIKKIEKNILENVKKRAPSLAILIDYPGFNLRLARKLKEMNVPVMYYVSPQIWAWGKGRMRKIKKIVDKMIVVFEFEKKIYERENVDVEWCGHPLLDIVYPCYDKVDFGGKIGLGEDIEYIGLFPGSRKQEVEKILPVMRDALEDSKLPYRGVVGCAPVLTDDFYKSVGGENLLYVRNLTYDLMAHAKLNLVASGTATLECAIVARPLFIMYKTSPLTYFLAKSLIKIPNIGLVNIVAGREIVPEFVQSACRANLVAKRMLSFLSSENRQHEMVEMLGEVKTKLGQKGASRKVAKIALGMVGFSGD